jgi:hypothetical protein
MYKCALHGYLLHRHDPERAVTQGVGIWSWWRAGAPREGRLNSTPWARSASGSAPTIDLGLSTSTYASENGGRERRASVCKVVRGGTTL